MTKSIGQLNEDRMMNRLPDIARRMRTYFVQLQRNVLPLKKVIDQLKQSYPEALADRNLTLFEYLFIFNLLDYYFRGVESSFESSSRKGASLDCIKSIGWNRTHSS